MAKAKDDLGSKLETAVSDLLKSMSGKEIDPELKMKALDRAIKFWALKNKIGDGSLGSAWGDQSDKGEE